MAGKRDYEVEMRKRNELRGEARLPLLDVGAEAARLEEIDLETAYANFFAHQMVGHAARWDQPTTSMMTALTRMGQERRAEEALAPEINRRWAEVVEAGTWVEWLDRTDAEPVSFQVWTPKDITSAHVR
jgi:hypothetical protein